MVRVLIVNSWRFGIRYDGIRVYHLLSSVDNFLQLMNVLLHIILFTVLTSFQISHISNYNFWRICHCKKILFVKQHFIYFKVSLIKVNILLILYIHFLGKILHSENQSNFPCITLQFQSSCNWIKGFSPFVKFIDLKSGFNWLLVMLLAMAVVSRKVVVEF